MATFRRLHVKEEGRGSTEGLVTWRNRLERGNMVEKEYRKKESAYAWGRVTASVPVEEATLPVERHEAKRETPHEQELGPGGARWRLQALCAGTGSYSLRGHKAVGLGSLARRARRGEERVSLV